jgi:hypothetical protein
LTRQRAAVSDRAATGAPERSFTSNRALVGPAVGATDVGHAAFQDAPQPSQDLGFRTTAKMTEILVSFQERLLNDV